MKLNFKAVGAGVFATIFAVNAHAGNFEFKPYVGFDMSMISADYKTTDGVSYGDVLADNFLGLNPYIGADLNEHFSVELGYLQTTEKGKSLGSVNTGSGPVSGETDMKLKGFHIDAIGKHAINDKVNLLGSVGLARLKAELELNLTGAGSASVKGDESDTAYRAGFGAEYALNDKVRMRGMIRYMHVDFSGAADNLMQYAVGLNYKF
ncbi:MAG: outer membrane beta-barrel protein [Pseudomonadota bacterium]|nr:outer membrane beta-barrel protein [Pseudomonadota bacterium]